MLVAFRPDESIIWDWCWQATIFLGLGLGASAVLARRPVRAHRLLVLAILAALAMPFLSQGARRGGWGVLTRVDENPSIFIATGTSTAPAAAGSPAIARVELPSSALPHARPFVTSRELVTADIESRPVQSAGDRYQLPYFGLRTLALGGWLILTSLAVVRLVTSLILSLILVRRARPLNDEILSAAVFTARARLGAVGTPELRASPRVRCPAIWCWGRRPVIVLPEDAAASSIAWVGVFCHELAHWKRRDHWSSLLGEVLVCALPWHPLAWLARRRLGQLSELACDDWVLASGLPGTDYAESLVSLVPQRHGAMALTAVSSRRGLIGRVRHILDERHGSPVAGMRWTCLSALAMVVAASAIALAQPRPVAKNQNSQLQDDTRHFSITNVSAANPKAKAKRRLVSGTVFGADRRPVPDATVVWIGHRKPPLPYRALPKDQEARPATRIDVIGEARTDTNGRFSLAAEFDPDRYNDFDGFDVNLLVRAHGLGMLSRFVKAGMTEVTLRLAPEAIIRGRLLTPSGMPAAGVRVTLNHIFGDSTTESAEGMGVGMTPTDDLIPAYWPKARTTDPDGRFTLEGVPQGTLAQLDFWHADYAVDEVVVDANPEGVIKAAANDWVKAFEITPVKPVFTHTLEPARPVQGRATDKKTGKPLGGLLIHMTPMRRHGGTAFYARTDGDGRYRVSGHSAEHYWTTVYPPADSGYIAVQDKNRSWPPVAKFLERDFALDRGHIVRGRVIDAETRRAIAGAAVCYRPQRKNPNGRDGFEHRNTILTDTDGRFAITTLPGRGLLLVETSDETYLRVPVPEKTGPDDVSPQGAVPIDVPVDEEPKLVEIALRKGAILKAKVIDPARNAVTDVVASCEGIDRMALFQAWQSAEKGLFQLSGLDSSRTYRFFFIQPDRELGAVVDLKPDSELKQPVEIVLQPSARVHGKVVTENGSPAEGVQVNPMIVMGNLKKGEMTRTEIMRATELYANLMGQKAMMPYVTKILQPKPKGEFVIDTLVPGANFFIAAGDRHREAYVSVPPLKPSEDRDLGAITIKERKP